MCSRWEPGSYGYHGDDGLKFGGNGGRGSNYGPQFSAGDTVGAALHMDTRQIFFTCVSIIVSSYHCSTLNSRERLLAQLCTWTCNKSSSRACLSLYHHITASSHHHVSLFFTSAPITVSSYDRITLSLRQTLWARRFTWTRDRSFSRVCQSLCRHITESVCRQYHCINVSVCHRVVISSFNVSPFYCVTVSPSHRIIILSRVCNIISLY